MNEKSIAMLKVLFEAETINEASINLLKSDKRKGVQKLILKYEKKKEQADILEKEFIRMSYYEQKNYSLGCEYIAGTDEAGRGPLAGPVVAAAVILPKTFKLLGLRDSKELSKTVRDKYYKIIIEQAISYGISVITNEKIDDINIYQATKKAMYGAIEQLNPRPNHVLIDAVKLEELICTSEVIIKGDQKSISIAAASIIAKVTRDRLMEQVHEEYPMYHFISNMGYGTKLHLEMLNKHGASPYHRRSFRPVEAVINQIKD